MNFALIGSAGYIAERHMKAIKGIDGNLIACLDKFDVMGRIDSYFPDSMFFLKEYDFWKHLEVLKGTNYNVDYVVVCTPNNLHHYFIFQSVERGYNVICEKPMVINTNEIVAIKSLLSKYRDRTVNGILQLRLHPVIKKIKEEFKPMTKKTKVKLEYFTPRGNWYHESWKTKAHMSGGLAMNIGIHFFDMLIWIFGKPEKVRINSYGIGSQTGTIELENAVVNYHLNLSTTLSPKRRLVIDNQDVEFTAGFTELHTESYKQILAGNGFTIEDMEESIKLAEQIRQLIK